MKIDFAVQDGLVCDAAVASGKASMRQCGSARPCRLYWPGREHRAVKASAPSRCMPWAAALLKGACRTARKAQRP